MLRQATDADLNQVEEGVYPTRADAAKALSKGHCMSMKRMGTYWGVSLPIGTSRMNMKR